jgi:hypothetical protein
MHMLIRAVVVAGSRDDALRTAEADVFDRLVRDSVFDYYRTLDNEDGEHGVAGADRWGHDIPAAARADTEAGEDLIEKGMAAMERAFRRNLVAVKLALTHLSDEEIRESLTDEEIEAVAAEHDVEYVPFLFDVRHAMYRLGQYRGPSVWLYDGTDWSGGTGVRTRATLHTIRDRAEDADGDLWVVPADVHH